MGSGLDEAIQSQLNDFEFSREYERQQMISCIV